jgi:transposase
MALRTKKRKSGKSKARYIGKPGGQIQHRVQDVGPEHFGVISVDCAKRRSKWMLCNFYGKVIVEPTTVEHTAGGLKAMIDQARIACKEAHINDCIAAVEMTGIYHRPVQKALRKAKFDTRIVHPFASKHYRKPLHPDIRQCLDMLICLKTTSCSTSP